MTARTAGRELTDLELLEAAARALRSFTLSALTARKYLDKPYTDDPRWSPWTRWLEPEARRAHDLSRMIRKRLAQDGIRVSGPDGAIPGLWPELPDGLESQPDPAALQAAYAGLRKLAEDGNLEARDMLAAIADAGQPS
jgi:hypothetical protein